MESYSKNRYTFTGTLRPKAIPPTLNASEDFSNVPDTTRLGGNVVTMI